MISRAGDGHAHRSMNKGAKQLTNHSTCQSTEMQTTSPTESSVTPLAYLRKREKAVIIAMSSRQLRVVEQNGSRIKNLNHIQQVMRAVRTGKD